MTMRSGDGKGLNCDEALEYVSRYSLVRSRLLIMEVH